MAVLHCIGGLDMLLLATATVLAGLYTWPAHRLLKSGLHWLPTAFLTMLTIAAAEPSPRSPSHQHDSLPGLIFGWLCDFEAGRIGLAGYCGWSQSSGPGRTCTAAGWPAWP